MQDKQAYIEHLSKVLRLFTRIDFEQYKEVTQDVDSPVVVEGVLRQMIAYIEASDDEAWRQYYGAGHGLAERHRLEEFGI